MQPNARILVVGMLAVLSATPRHGYTDSINRTGVEALIPEEVSREIIQDIPTTSKVMQLARRLPNMARAQQRMPVLANLPAAYFVNGDTGLKQATRMAWENKFIVAEEIAVIVPIPEAVLDDQDYDIWGEVKPRILEALGAKFDAAVLVGDDAPSSWPDDLLTGAAAASQTIDLSTQVAAGEDLYDVIMGETGLLALLEADGFFATGHIAVPQIAGKLRGLRDGAGQPIFKRTMANGQNMQERTRYDLDGAPIEFLDNGAVAASEALMFSAQWNQIVYAIRQDITYKILDQAVINDSSGNIIWNLPQQDMIALRCVMRLGWQVPNPVKKINTDSTTRYPAAVLVP